VFFSSHSLADIEELCDSFALLHHGEIRYVGGAEELRRRTGASSLDAAFLAALDEPTR
jgi:ABC-2 type transport system ATP-binding protein